MNTILITGATGNIGMPLIRNLMSHEPDCRVVAGVRDVEKAAAKFREYPQLQTVRFDFEDPATFAPALTGIDRIFLLRPPHLSDADRYFRPLIAMMKEKKVQQVVFLSVQGAEKSKVIPHNKIERLIRSYGLEYVFLRPSYFMQNLTTTLQDDLLAKRQIILPAGRARFNWIDIENIAQAAALILKRFEAYKDQAIEITGTENEDFFKVASLIRNLTGHPVVYRPVSPLRFFLQKKKEGMQQGMILVMIMLHYLPRFQKEPRISGFYEQLTGKKPTTLEEFIAREMP